MTPTTGYGPRATCFGTATLAPTLYRARPSRVTFLPVRRDSFALILLLVLSCAREGSPADAYRAFTRAVADRDADRAFGLLSRDTQAWLDSRAAQVAAVAPGVVPASGRQLLLGDASLAPRPPIRVTVVRESRDAAVLEVSEEHGPPRAVQMVRDGGWRVRVPPPAP